MTETHERLQQARIAAGYQSVTDAATSLGIPYPTYAGHENGTTGMRTAVAERYARKFKVSLDWLVSGRGQMGVPERMAPILGLAGAGPDGSVLFAEGDGNFGQLPAPIDSADTVAALEVRGNSMHGLASDGWILFYEEKTEPRDEYMGEPCICWLEDSRVLVKIPEPTRFVGLFNLVSVNAPTMRDIAVREMALITDIKTRRAAQRFVRRNPDQKVADLKVSR